MNRRNILCVLAALVAILFMLAFLTSLYKWNDWGGQHGRIPLTDLQVSADHVTSIEVEELPLLISGPQTEALRVHIDAQEDISRFCNALGQARKTGTSHPTTVALFRITIIVDNAKYAFMLRKTIDYGYLLVINSNIEDGRPIADYIGNEIGAINELPRRKRRSITHSRNRT